MNSFQQLLKTDRSVSIELRRLFTAAGQDVGQGARLSPVVKLSLLACCYVTPVYVYSLQGGGRRILLTLQHQHFTVCCCKSAMPSSYLQLHYDARCVISFLPQLNIELFI